MDILVSWIGRSDFTAKDKNDLTNDPGPILRFLRAKSPGFDKIVLFDDMKGGKHLNEVFIPWLIQSLGRKTEFRDRFEHKSGPPLGNNYARALEVTEKWLSEMNLDPSTRVHFLVSPGQPAMQHAMNLLAHRMNARLWASSPHADVEEVPRPEDVVIHRTFGPARLEDLLGVTEGRPDGFDEIVGNARNLLGACRLAAAVACADGAVFLFGESGSGKELFAKAIHTLSGRLAAGKCVPINCAAIPENLMESELFGHTEGSFTGATKQKDGAVTLANRGTLFLDEVGEMPLKLQAMLLRFLNDATFVRVGGSKVESSDVRIITATHRNLDEMVRAGRFREDLYHRIIPFVVQIPPLRHRGNDVILLADAFLKKGGGNGLRFSDEAQQELRRYTWPGNVRELQNVVKRLNALLPAGTEISAAHVRIAIGAQTLFDPTRPLDEMSPLEFLHHVNETVAEMLRRYNPDGNASTIEKESIFTTWINPVVVYKALELAGGIYSSIEKWTGVTTERGKAGATLQAYETLRTNGFERRAGR